MALPAFFCWLVQLKGSVEHSYALVLQVRRCWLDRSLEKQGTYGVKFKAVWEETYTIRLHGDMPIKNFLKQTASVIILTCCIAVTWLAVPITGGWTPNLLVIENCKYAQGADFKSLHLAWLQIMCFNFLSICVFFCCQSMLRGRGGCYKHTFYGIESHRCMEATPSLACANKCVFCWR